MPATYHDRRHTGDSKPASSSGRSLSSPQYEHPPLSAERRMPQHSYALAHPLVGSFPAHPSPQLHGLQQPDSGTEQSSSPSPLSKAFNFVESPGNTVKKRPRRRFDEIERLYSCNYGDCTKAYGTLNHLNSHVQAQNHGPKRDPSEYKQVRKMWRKAKKERDAASGPSDTIIPPPGSLDLGHYNTCAPLPRVSNSNSSSYIDDERFYKFNSIRRDGPMYSEKSQPDYARGLWTSADDRQEPEFQRSYPDNSSYVDDWSKSQWSRTQHPEANSYQGLSIDTTVPYSQQDRSPITPLTPPSGSPVYLHDPIPIFGADSTSTTMPEYPSHTPSPPYSTPDSSDSYRYPSYHEPQPHWASTSPAARPSYHIQAASNALISSSYPPPSHQHDAMSPGGVSSYSAPSPTYGQNPYSSAGVTARSIPPQYPSWRGQDGQ